MVPLPIYGYFLSNEDKRSYQDQKSSKTGLHKWKE